MMPSIVAYKPKNLSVSLNECYNRGGSIKFNSSSDPSDKSEKRLPDSKNDCSFVMQLSSSQNILVGRARVLKTPAKPIKSQSVKCVIGKAQAIKESIIEEDGESCNSSLCKCPIP